MITEEQLWIEIENRVRLKLESRMKYEIKEGAEIGELMELVHHLKGENLLSNTELYKMMKSSDILVAVERLTGDLELTKEVSKIINKAKEKLAIPAGMTEENMREYMRDSRIIKIMLSTRNELTKVLEKRTKKPEEMRKKLADEIRKEEMKKVFSVMAKTQTLTDEGEKVEAEYLQMIKQLMGMMIRRDVLNEELIAITGKDVEITPEHMEFVDQKISEKSKLESEMSPLEAKKERLEEILISKKDQIVELIYKEILQREVPAEEKEKVRELVRR